MSGALTERVFVAKLQRVGFTDVAVGGRLPFPMDRAAAYPLFTPDLLALMDALIPEDRRDRIATSVIVTARKPV